MERRSRFSPLIRDHDAEVALDALLETHRAPGVALQRIYPPTAFPYVRSWLGGLPQLPNHVQWPLGVSHGQSVPMHFLAQIDCTELPHVDPDMPTEGMLFFFAVHDDDPDWSADDPHDRVRVIYAPQVRPSQRERPAPRRLRPIRDIRVHSDPAMKPGWLLPHENGPRLHVRWALEAKRMDTWPDAALLPAHARGLDDDAYARRVDELRSAAVVAATGMMPLVDAARQLERSLMRSWRYPRGWLSRQPEFPQLGIMIDRIARLVGNERCAGKRKISEFKDVQEWVRQARSIGWENAPDNLTRTAFRDWLMHIASPETAEGQLNGRSMSRVMTDGLLAAVAVAGSSQQAAACIPSTYYRELEGKHLPFADSNSRHPDGRRRCPVPRVHQMLGHPSFPLEYGPDLDGDAVCLLRLAADPSIDMTFGRHRQATFVISREDLRRRCFDHVAVVEEGPRMRPLNGIAPLETEPDDEDPCPSLGMQGEWDEREEFSTRPPYVHDGVGQEFEFDEST
jgi:hypothetical protein